MEGLCVDCPYKMESAVGEELCGLKNKVGWVDLAQGTINEEQKF